MSGGHIHPHAFRHCFAVTYIRRGGDIYRLSRPLGHASIVTTQRYLRSMSVDVITDEVRRHFDDEGDLPEIRRKMIDVLYRRMVN